MKISGCGAEKKEKELRERVAKGGPGSYVDTKQKERTMRPLEFAGLIITTGFIGEG